MNVQNDIEGKSYIILLIALTSNFSSTRLDDILALMTKNIIRNILGRSNFKNTLYQAPQVPF